MRSELEYFPKAVPYFRKFVAAHLIEFHSHMLEYRTYPQGGYGSFYRDNEIIQVLINIYHNIDESFGDLRIPETFASPKALARGWKTFYDFLKNDDKLFDDVYKKLKSIKEDEEDFPYPIILIAIDEDRKKVIDALEHILSLSEVIKYLKGNDFVAEKEKKVNFQTVPSRIFDIVIITAIYKEYEQMIKFVENGFIPNFYDPSRTTYYQGEFTIVTGKKVKVLVVCANQMGMTSAASLASKTIYRFTPKVIAMCGIAAGISGEVGDIMIPDILWDYGSGKSTLEPKKSWLFRTKYVEKFSPYRFPITIRQELIGALIRLTKETNICEEVFNLGKHIVFNEKPTKLTVNIGPFVSGSAVVANDKVLEQIKSQDGKLVGFDMEAFAIAYAAGVSDITPQPIAFIAKSVSDYGNMKKSHQDKEFHQEYAAFTSASFIHKILVKHPDLFELT